MRSPAVWLSILSSMLLAGCASLIDTEQRRLCRSLLPAFNEAGSRFELGEIEEVREATGKGAVVAIAYRPIPGEQSVSPNVQPRRLICSFGPAPANGSPKLEAITTETGVLGPLRLRILQRYWIDTGLAQQSDPMPVTFLPGAPSLPQPVAIALQQLLGSLPAIAVYALLATAYSLVYGLIGRINLAFGDLASLAGYGAFLGFSMLSGEHAGLAVLAAGIFGLFTAAMHGGTIGRYVVSRLAAGPGQHILIATIGISIFWQEAMRLTQGSGNRWLSPLLNRPLGIARSETFTVTITPMAVVVAVVAISAASVLTLVMRRSRFGLAWRASADDPVAAAMFGIDARGMLVKTMVLAALMAGLGGVLTTLYYGGVGYAGGLVVGLKALIAAIAGGIGSIRGALWGGVLVGLAETIWSTLFTVEYRDAAIFAGLVFVLLLRPNGLFGEELPEHSKRF